MFTYKPQRGQALVLIVFAIVGLIAMVGLAVDSGNSFADRRNAQSAADNAAIAAALQKVQAVPTGWQLAATNMATSNGYTDDGGIGITTVDVYSMDDPLAAGCGSALPVIANPEEYILVTIHSTVDMMFGPIIGIRQTHNCVYAIAHGKPSVKTSLFYGNAVASTSCDAPSAILASGSSSVLIEGGGLFSNSSANPAISISWESNLTTPSDSGVTAVGGVDIVHGGYPSPISENNSDLQICPMPEEMFPDPDDICTDTIAELPYAEMAVNGAGQKIIPPGIHCITGDFRKDDYFGTNVTLVMLNNGLDWEGNVEVDLSSPFVGPTAGLLIYLPPTNDSTIKMRGTAGMRISGSVLAPSSAIIWIGNFGNTAMQSQWIGKTFDMSGNTNAHVIFNDSRAYKYSAPANVELTQ